MDTEPAPTGGFGWHIVVLLIFVFLWLIPLFHASRAGRVLPIIEVMLLLALSVLIPIVAGIFGAGSLLVGAVFVVPMMGAAGVLWFAALLIALAAELGQAMRPPKTRYGEPQRVPDGENYQRRRQ